MLKKIANKEKKFCAGPPPPPFFFLIGQSEKSGIEIESEYQLTGHPVYQIGHSSKSI